MTLRTRLTLAFVYILTTIIVALTIPLAFNLSRRAETEFERDTLIVAQTTAAVIPVEHLLDPSAVRTDVRRVVTEELADSIERIVVVDAEGAVVWDSAGEEPVGSDFANTGRPEVQNALTAGIASAEVRFSEEEGREIMVAAAPIIDATDVTTTVGAVRLTRRIDDVRGSVRSTTLGLIAVGGAGLLAGVVIAFGLASSFARPIQRLATTATRLGRGDLSARAGDDVRGAREIEELAGSFDEMADRVERTVRAQREFVANASHQLRTPLTGMKLRLESASADEPDPQRRADLDAAEREVDRLAEIVARLLAAAREIEEGAVTHVDLDDTVDRAVERWSKRAGRLGAAVTTVARTDPPDQEGAGQPDGRRNEAVANPSDVDQVLDNLIDNALAYGAGPVEIETGLDGDRAWLAVRDHGQGFAPDERERVTERFFRGRGAAAKGSGLGLAIARELAEKWGGGLTVEAPDDGGARVVVRFRSFTGP